MARSTPAWRTVATLATMTALYTLPASAQAARARLVIDDVTVQFEGRSGSSVATFTISFVDNTSHGPVTVSVSTTTGTATSGNSCATGVDFVGVNALTLSFSPAQQSQQLPITVCGDERDENDETFTLLLSNASGADIQDNQGQATLIDDDPPPSLRVNDITITEGAAGAVNNAVFTVTISAASGKPVTVQVQGVASTAAAGNCGTAGADFAPTATSLTFPATSGPGGTNSPAQTVSVPVCGDGLREGNEQFQLRLSNASNATIADPTGAATITDDEPIPTLAIAANVAVDEPGGVGLVNAVFNVTLAGGAAQTTQTVTVGYVTANVTAIGGVCLTLGSGKADYGTTEGTLTFAPGGPLVQQIRVPICRDAIAEPDQAFTVTLRDESNATVLNRVGTGTIRGTANP